MAKDIMSRRRRYFMKKNAKQVEQRAAAEASQVEQRAAAEASQVEQRAATANRQKL